MTDTETPRSPAFQFYPKDFLGDANVVVMSLRERGAYITLLCYCWMDGSIPSDLTRLARLCRVSIATFQKLWPALELCFRHGETLGRLVHPRLERERQKQAEYREAGRAAGLASGRARRQRFANDSPTESPKPFNDSRTPPFNDSSTKHERVTNGKRTDPLNDSRTKTNSSSSSSSSSSDFGHTHTHSGGVMAGTLPRDHLSHAFCGKVCVPAFLHEQFMAGLATDTANETLRDFYRRTLDTITGPMAPDPVKFWRDRVAARWPAPDVTRKPSEVRAGGDAYTAFNPKWAEECFTLHGNECANAKAHAAKMHHPTTAIRS